MGYSPDVVKPGAALIDVIRERAKTGSLPRDPAQYRAEVMAQMAASKIIKFVNEAPDGRPSRWSTAPSRERLIG